MPMAMAMPTATDITAAISMAPWEWFSKINFNSVALQLLLSGYSFMSMTLCLWLSGYSSVAITLRQWLCHYIHS